MLCVRRNAVRGLQTSGMQRCQAHACSDFRTVLVSQSLRVQAGMCKRVCFEHPEAAQALVCARFSGSEASTAPVRTWSEAVAQISLSGAQQDELLALSNNYRRDMATSAEARKELIDAMAAATPAQVIACSVQSQLSLENKRCVKEMQEVLRQEHQMHSEYMVGALDKVRNASVRNASLLQACVVLRCSNVA